MGAEITRKDVLRKLTMVKSGIESRIEEIGAMHFLYQEHPEIKEILDAAISLLVLSIEVLETASNLI